MVWAPTSVRSIINFSSESINFTNPDKIKLINSKISSLEEKIHLNAITNQELKVCLQLIDENISLIKDDVIQGGDSAKQIRQRITNLFSSLKNIASTQLVEVSGVNLSPIPSLKPVPVLNLVFLCDIDCPDANGATALNIAKALKDNIPFVVSKSLLGGSDLDPEESKIKNIFNAVLEEYPNWNIYKKGEFVAFIPKNYLFNAEELSFDFSPENQVQSLREIFEGPTENAGIEGFIHLFKPNSQVDKRIILSGHGNEGFIGGLKLENYHRLIEHLQNSGCRSLEIQACYGGSINAIKHYFETENPENPKKLESDPTTPLKQPNQTKETRKVKITPSFPIIITSIGSFVTWSSWYHSPYKSYFENMDKLLALKGTSTVPQFRKAAQGSESKNFENFMQIKFPHQLDSPGGFRPLGEDERTQAISYVDVQRAKHDKVDFIEVKDKEFVELLPMEVDFPIQVTKKTSSSRHTRTLNNEGVVTTIDLGEDAPIFLSMIPGDAHHLIHKIKGEGFSLLELFSKDAYVYKKCSSIKAFFIGKIELKDKVYSKVVLEFSEEVMNLFYAEGEPEVYHHYQFKGNSGTLTEHHLTESEFCFNVAQVANRSKPNLEALRVSSGGQENEDQFLTNLMHNLFWESALSNERPLPSDYALYEQYEQKPTPENAESLFNAISLSSHQLILQRAISSKDDILTKLLLAKGSIDVNKETAAGSYLIHTATKLKNGPIVKLLIEKGADLNKAGLYNKTPLMIAVQTNELEIVKLLLENPNAIDFDLEDSLGWTALTLSGNLSIFDLVYNALKNKLILDRKLEEEPLKTALEKQLNHVTTYGFTMLSYATWQGDKKCVEKLFELGADPYVGKASCLSMAICQRNKEMVEYWLEKGIEVTKVDGGGNSALGRACEVGTLEILPLILKQVDLTSLPQAPEYLKKAILAGNFTKASLLLDEGAKTDFAKLDYIVAGVVDSSLFRGLFLSKDFKFLDKLIDMGLFNAFNSLDPEKREVFDLCVEIFDLCLADNSSELGKRFVKIFQKQINQPFSYARECNLLLIAYNKKNQAMLKLLLENGADALLETCSERVSFLDKLIDEDDAETLQLCLKYVPGLSLNDAENKKNFLALACEKNWLKIALDKGNLPLFKTLVEHGVNPLQKPIYGDSLFVFLLKQSKPEWLKFCLETICPQKDGTSIPLKEVLQAISAGNMTSENFQLLIEYGAGVIRADNNEQVKEILKKTRRIEDVSFALNSLPPETVKAFLNSRGFGGDYLNKTFERDDFTLFELLLKHGANPLNKMMFGGSVFDSLLKTSKPEWLKLCLKTLCPQKNGMGLSAVEIFKETNVNTIQVEAFKQLLEYGMQILNPPGYELIKEIFKNVKGLDLLNLIFNSIPLEVKQKILKEDDYLISILYSDNIEVFKLFIEHGADPLYKLSYGSVFSSILTSKKPEWLKLCLDKICPQKNGENIPVEKSLSTVQYGSPDVESLKLLRDYGMGLGNPEAIAILDKAIEAKQNLSK
jgi:ankyrin repeat protein